MKKSTLVTLTCFAVIFGLLGCAQPASDPSKETNDKGQVALSLADIRGVYQTDCILRGPGQTSKSYKMQIAVYDGKAVHLKQEYTSPNCAQASELNLTTQTFGFVLQEITKTGTAIDLYYEDILHRPQVQAEAVRYNKDKECGFTNWQLNQDKEVNNLKCLDTAFPAREVKVFSQIELVEQVLRLGGPTGAQDIGNSEATRHTGYTSQTYQRVK